MSLRRLLVLGLVCVATTSACAEPPSEATDTNGEALTTYGDLVVTLEGADLDRWYAVRAALKSGFERICGDTICGGDYSNLTTVSLDCSSTVAHRKMKGCTWVLGGSIDHVDGAAGTITTDARVFTCKVPVSGTAPLFLRALEEAGDEALHAPLPGTGRSFYDALVDCFDGVTGPPPPGTSKAPVYRDLGEWLGDHADGSSWSAITRRLARDFDQICGDTFCEGEYPDIAPLRFVCSVKADTEEVPRCRWSFAAVEVSVTGRGTITTNVATKQCDVAIDAPATALVRALSAPEPLYAPLPGRTTSVYDALIGCL